MSTKSPELPRPRWLLSESWRFNVSALMALPPAFTLVVVLGRANPQLDDMDQRYMFSSLIAWTTIALVHTLVTWLTFRGLEGTPLRRAVGVESATWQRAAERGGTVWRTLITGGRGVGWSISISSFALVVTGLLAFTPELRQQTALLVVGIAMVATSWANVVVMFGVHYARQDIELGGDSLVFGGDEVSSFSDYLYFAIGVQTTFGTTDTTVAKRAMRRTVAWQGVLAFVFNTMIVAVIVSLLLGSPAT